MSGTQANKNVLPRFDQLLLVVVISLILLGYVMMFSSSLHIKDSGGGDTLFYPIRQLIFIVLGIATFCLVSSVPMVFWEKFGPALFVIGLLLLVLVLIPGIGIEANGSRRWLALGSIRIQTSELAKFTTVVYMAGYVVRHQQDMQQSPYGVIRPLLLLAIACVLLLQEPDYGSAVVIVTTAMGMMFLGGARLKQFFLLLGLFVVLAVILIMTEGYRLRRVTAFLDPWADAKDSGYQLVQALVSFGRGEIFGVGLGNGIQKLFYLPEGHTDFLFSVLGEELGLIGVLSVISLFTLLVWRAFQIAAKAEANGQIFAAYVAYGMAIWIGFQAFVNMGVNMGVLPTKGLTLPLMSYGGGSMIVTCAAIALLFRVHWETIMQHQEKPRGATVWTSAS